MNILEQIRNAAAAAAESFNFKAFSKDKKFLLCDDGTVLNCKNIDNAEKSGIITVEGTKITLVKGRCFTNAEGITFFTDKEVTAPSFS